jgi:hypothetical protein
LTRIKKGTAKLKTAKNENVFGGKKGSAYDNKRSIATMELRRNIN